MRRCYKRRWIVERTIRWLGNFRRLAVRDDRSLQIYRAFFHRRAISRGREFLPMVA